MVTHNGNDVIAPTAQAATLAVTFPPLQQSSSSFSLPFPCCRCSCGSSSNA